MVTVSIKSLAELAVQLDAVRANQVLTMKYVQLILKVLELRHELRELDKEMEENNGSLAPVAIDAEGE